jgi:transcriptional regulator with XRE-family HTH domain
MTGESVASYIRRLANANHLRPGYLRRYLRSRPGAPGTVSLEWLAALAGRPVPALEHALADLAGHHPPRPGQRPPPTRRHRRQAGKPELFAAIRQDAREKGLSIRALADRHGVHRRTVREALTSPQPAPRKKPPPRRSRLDPFKDAIDVILQADLDDPDSNPHTAMEIFHRLKAEHEMNGVSYSTVCAYVASRRAPRSRRLRHDR